jgi:hypothetical protein
VKEPAFGLRDAAAKFPGRLQPFREHSLDVGKSHLPRGAIGSATRQFWHFGDESSVLAATTGAQRKRHHNAHPHRPVRSL